MTVLVDTCIVVDALTKREPFGEPAAELLRLGAEKRINLLFSAKSFLDTHYLLKHYLHEESKVRGILSSLLRCLTIVEVMGKDCALALNSPASDYEDAVQYEVVLNYGADGIVTRDKHDFPGLLIPLLSPAQAIEKLRPIDDEE